MSGVLTPSAASCTTESDAHRPTNAVSVIVSNGVTMLVARRGTAAQHGRQLDADRATRRRRRRRRRSTTTTSSSSCPRASSASRPRPRRRPDAPRARWRRGGAVSARGSRARALGATRTSRAEGRRHRACGCSGFREPSAANLPRRRRPGERRAARRGCGARRSASRAATGARRSTYRSRAL